MIYIAGGRLIGIIQYFHGESMQLWNSLRTWAIGLSLAATSIHAATAVDAYGHLKVQGTQIQSQSGKPAVLRGMSMYWSLPAWGNATQFWNANVVKWLADDWHANVVRAAMAVEHGGYLTNPSQQKEFVDVIVQAAVNKGIYVIIDWHDHNAENHEAAAVAFFQEMARKYGHLPNVIYEVFNEPERQSWSTVKSYSIKVIDAIRAIDPDNLILVGSPQWDQAVRQAADDPITGRANIAYTMHFYAGTHSDWLRGESDYALTKIPLFISEWGASNADGNGGPFTASADTWLTWADQRNLSWCNWSVHNLSESSAALKASASPNGNWHPTNDLSASGQYVRGKMRAANPAPNAYVAGLSSSSAIASSSSIAPSSSSVAVSSSSKPSSSSAVASSSSIAPSSSSVAVSSSSKPSSSSAVASSSSVLSGTCVAFVNGTGAYDTRCYKSGLSNMAPNTCYTMNPARKPAPLWINSNANETWWWVTTSCGSAPSSSSVAVSSSSVKPSSSSVVASSSSVKPSSSSVVASSSSVAPSSSSVVASSSSVAPSSSSVVASSSSIAPSSSSVIVSSSSVVSSSSTGGGLCANPVAYTGGSVNVGPAGLCLRINASSYKNGVMASVRNNGTAYTQASWWGGVDQNATACVQGQKVLSGNGAQFNNFVIGKDAAGYSYLFVKSTDTKSYSVSIDAQNWQNGSGCGGVAPPLARRLMPVATSTEPAYFGLNGTRLPESDVQGVYYERDAQGSMRLKVNVQ
jgi:endoglucanase